MDDTSWCKSWFYFNVILAKLALNIIKNRKKIRKKNHIAKSWIWTCAFSGRSKFGVRITKCAEKFDGFSNFSWWAHHGTRFSYVSKWPEKWGEFTSIGHFWRILEEQVEILQKQHFFRANQRLPMKRGQIRTL